MQIFTFSEARQKFASVLDRAKKDGKVCIRRRDGSVFAVTPEVSRRSPLDVRGLKTSIKTEEIVAAVREGRER